jgi:uncharacterized membrane protein YjjP (DUF1212 family)
MAVVAGVVFFAVRALLALFPALATGFPIKKWSAAAALVAAAFYLLLSGAEVATQRSFFMTAVVLIAYSGISRQKVPDKSPDWRTPFVGCSGISKGSLAAIRRSTPA